MGLLKKFAVVCIASLFSAIILYSGILDTYFGGNIRGSFVMTFIALGISYAIASIIVWGATKEEKKIKREGKWRG